MVEAKSRQRNKSKGKGTAAETRVVNFLLAAQVEASRVVMKGSKDEGDIHFRFPVGPRARGIMEVKGGKQTANVGRQQRDEWLAETRKEAKAAETCLGFLCIAKHRASVCDYLVWSMDGKHFWYLDDFVKWLHETS